MSIQSVKRALASLPYTEMRALGDQLIATLHQRRPPGAVGLVGLELDAVCDALATLPAGDDKQLEAEEVFLGRAFTKKRGGKVMIMLKPTGTGWEVKVGDFTQVGKTVRSAISELLDHIAAYEALMK